MFNFIHSLPRRLGRRQKGTPTRCEEANGHALRADELTKSYGERVVIAGASLAVRPGDGLALLGPNGCGKTTLLSLLAGVLPSDSGSAVICGLPVRLREARRLLGYVPQDLALYEELTARENAAFFGRLCGLRGPALEDGVQSALEASELWHLRDERVSTFSGGMRRRLSVACALVHAPRVLLLDEPFAGIDEQSCEKLLDVLAARKQSGVALVLSTHRLDEVAALCDRFVVISRGGVIGEPAYVGESDEDSELEPDGGDA
nr:ABC transporter ATP-binding protein [uncultured bacterium]